jgi:SAM-dependent methyltransferase
MPRVNPIRRTDIFAPSQPPPLTDESSEPTDGLYTSHVGDNDLLIEQVAQLYLRPGMRVADITYGKGTFWLRIDLDKYHFFPSDIVTVPECPHDFREELPYEPDSFDVVVFDPPYTHNPGQMIVNDSYQLKETTKGFYHDDIIKLYRQGMTQAVRILKPGGTLWVKCMDEIESGVQRLSHIEIYEIARLALSLQIQDLFVITQKYPPVVQHKRQKHARKNHSYLWVFRKDMRTNEEG